jgi:hypothetical protein
MMSRDVSGFEKITSVKTPKAPKTAKSNSYLAKKKICSLILFMLCTPFVSFLVAREGIFFRSPANAI